MHGAYSRKHRLNWHVSCNEHRRCSVRAFKAALNTELNTEWAISYVRHIYIFVHRLALLSNGYARLRAMNDKRASKEYLTQAINQFRYEKPAIICRSRAASKQCGISDPARPGDHARYRMNTSSSVRVVYRPNAVHCRRYLWIMPMCIVVQEQTDTASLMREIYPPGSGDPVFRFHHIACLLLCIITNADGSHEVRFHGRLSVCLSVCLSARYLKNRWSYCQLGSTNLTQKCSTMSPGNPCIVGSKGQKSRGT